MITLDSIDYLLHSIAIKETSNGYELAIDSNGYITANINGSVTVSATDLDIRSLNVATDGDHVYLMDSTGTNALAIDASGYVTANINGDVNVTQGTDPWVVSATDLDIRDLSSATDSVTAVPSGLASWKVTAVSVTDTESELVATPLAGRVRILIQNLGSNDIYLKEATGVTSSNGVKIPKGSSYEADLESAANLFAITASGSSDIRIVEYAA